MVPAGTNQQVVSILIAEDEPINFMLLQKMLEKVPARILWAKNGLEATDLVRQNDSIRLVLMDIRMPGMNGIEATRAIGDIKPGLPVVAVTAFTLSNERQKCLQAGAAGFLTKPVHPEKLLEEVRKYIAW